ncbi:ATP-binding cassette domain-containing protein [Vibrio sp. SS-MA-C1-2]|uniref:ATP-binding cassette domain-containing protein n=1 Tax=Vibrio sp. SS-MA-C1-2 TaxID=2908646 RepID=UPI001F28DFE1|nr:ATP-binding cassette domain-containing protein [Vibrio sp. SS-MA-C1-2]UJF17117.1 ATP-binding cassette domain-containing protein [Vibrio sp. SS-MA-C1-2]
MLNDDLVNSTNKLSSHGDEVIVDFHALEKRFDKTVAIKKLSGQIKAGRLTGLVGPDGAGKTTLLRMMTGLMVATEGELKVVGRNPKTESEQLTIDVGYMPQRFGLYEDLTIQENLELYAKLRSIPKQQQSAIFENLLQFTRLKPFTSRLAGNLSGGMKQKLGLACALMAKPKLLLLDEPGVGVDPVSRQDLWAMVQQLTDDGMAVVWATAYLEEAERCDDVLLLEQGELIYQGQPSELTETLQGRSFAISGAYQQRRQVLADLLKQSFVSDGVIQGDNLRAVLISTTDPTSTVQLERKRSVYPLQELKAFCKTRQLIVTEVEPRFEDAFIDLLGGVSSDQGALADTIPEIEQQHQDMVECHQLTRKFGQFTATDNVSFTVKRGEVFGLLGPNGAGKSTTFKMLCGLLATTSGSAKVVGLELGRSGKAAKLQLGYMAQKFSLYNLLSVKQNLAFSAGVYGLSGKQKKQRIAEMVKTFHLQPYLNRSPDELSLGYKQRLALACAIMHNPSVLFLDEPTSGVDPITRREFWGHINSFVAKGMTIMVTTHFMDEAEYCDRIALMYQAKLIALDAPDKLKLSVANEGESLTMEQAFIRLIEQEDRNLLNG